MKLLSTIVIASCLFAQQPVPPGPPVVRAQGTATVTATPDQLKIDVGVVSQAQTAQAAGAANAKQAAEVIAELKRVAGTSAEIRTVNYTVSPNYKFNKDGGSPTIVGYTATNIVQVTTPDIQAAAVIIDGATKHGANNVHGIQFSLKDEQAVRSKALGLATRQARASAEAMAASLGLGLGRIVRIEDSAPVEVHPVREMAQMRAMAADSASTPIETGSIRVQATVFVTAEVVNPAQPGR